MGVLKTLALIAQAVLLVLQWLKDREAASVGREQALRELTSALNEHIAAAKAAREAPHDDTKPDPYDRG